MNKESKGPVVLYQYIFTEKYFDIFDYSKIFYLT